MNNSICSKCSEVCKSTSPRKECELFNSNETISISRKVAEEVLRSGYQLPNELYDELKKALKEVKK